MRTALSPSIGAGSNAATSFASRSIRCCSMVSSWRCLIDLRFRFHACGRGTTMGAVGSDSIGTRSWYSRSVGAKVSALCASAGSCTVPGSVVASSSKDRRRSFSNASRTFSLVCRLGSWYLESGSGGISCSTRPLKHVFSPGHGAPSGGGGGGEGESAFPAREPLLLLWLGGVGLACWIGGRRLRRIDSTSSPSRSSKSVVRPSSKSSSSFWPNSSSSPSSSSSSPS
mmetsp:Transcript_24694/g.78874  ORF Transcript_24694/g.78874 Transcript_24694/m.78874 type:complete len:227 (+) Transcript_24694:533-1213(+)